MNQHIMSKKVSNFDFLNNFDLILVRLGTFAESYPENDPHASLIRLRQYGEILSRNIAEKFNIYVESVMGVLVASAGRKNKQTSNIKRKRLY